MGMGYSGHADQEGILDWIFHEHRDRRMMVGKTIFLNHGNNTEREALAAAIRSRAAELGRAPAPEVLMPQQSDGWYDLDEGRWLTGQDSPGDLIGRLERCRTELDACLEILKHRSVN